MKLLAGPFCGEFGHELFCWQGFIRRLAKDYEKTEVICREGNEILYEDFADRVISYPCDNYETDGHRCKNENEYKHKRFIQEQNLKYDVYQSGWIKLGYTQNYPQNSKATFYHQTFHKYGEVTDDPEYNHDILLHIRSSNKCGTAYRNISPLKFKEILQPFRDLDIACIGHPSGSAAVKGYTDLLGIPLRALVKHMANSKVIVGPSSGPMHLASLCGLPQITWSGRKHNQVRYEKYWNPFDTPCKHIFTGNFKDWNVKNKEATIQRIIREFIKEK